MEKSRDFFPRIRLAVNCDGIGMKNSTNCFSCHSFSDKPHDTIRSLASYYPDLTEAVPWYQGDHMLFAMQKIPTLACTSYGISDILETIIHTSRDTPAMIDICHLQTFTRFLSDICEIELAL